MTEKPTLKTIIFGILYLKCRETVHLKVLCKKPRVILLLYLENTWARERLRLASQTLILRALMIIFELIVIS